MKLFLLITLFSVSYATECPGGKHACPEDATCCQLPDKSYGCCPLRNAVCCDDHIHCCPEGGKCTASMCIQEHLNSTFDKVFYKEYKHVCPGLKYSCLDNSTCCETSIPGMYGCCPMPNAICCSDGSHCCPKGTKCDLEKEKCVGEKFFSEMIESEDKHAETKASVSMPFSPFFSKAKRVKSVICPGGSFQCPNGYTCCELESGVWGCCPFVHATCCSDHLHCCPEGMKCDATSQSCNQDSKNVTWVKNEKALHISEVKSNVCPGGEYKCPDEATCCQLSTGAWGCCQYSDAVCCSDHTHCCPNGYICNLVGKFCDKGYQAVPWLKKLSAKLLSDHFNVK